MSGFSKRNKNKVNRHFSVGFVERLFDGSPRWFNSNWNEHQKRVGGDKTGALNREQNVRVKMRQSHDWQILFRQDHTSYLWTCVNPHCNLRIQKIWPVGFIRKQSSPQRRDLVREHLRKNLGALASAEPAKLAHACPSCYEKVRPFAVEAVKKKWVYVLKETAGSLSHYCEIEVENWNKGTIHKRLRKGKYANRPAKPFKGAIQLTKANLYKWHFFLSPVRLGKQALALLAESNNQEKLLAQLRDRANPAKAGVPIDKALQPWQPTVVREFSKGRLKISKVELVPLVDPFAWAAQVSDFDYALILAAQQNLVRDPNEQAKAFIAATLHQAIGRKMISKNPPKWKDEDKWEIKDDTLRRPWGAKGSNIAEGWIERYKSAVKYLTDETNKACARLVFILRYSLAHRIVELGCQDWDQENGFLSLGLTQWSHLLREIPACEVGQQFVAWLTASPTTSSAPHPMTAAERIPVKNVLNGDGLKNASKVSKETGLGLPLFIFSALSGGVIARHKKHHEAIVKHLANINVKAEALTNVNTKQKTLTFSDLKAGKDLSLSVSGGVLERYIEKMPESADFKTVHKYTIARDWKKRLSIFEKLSESEAAISILSAIKDFSKKPRAYGNGYDQYSKVKEKIEAPIKVANFLAKNTREVLKLNMSQSGRNAVEQLEKKGAQEIANLSIAEYEALIGSRSIRAYRLLGTGMRVLAGPVGVLIGGADMVSQSMQTIDAWEANDPGAAVGHGLQAAAGVLIIAVAGAECVALMTGAAAAAWAGPVGWIAAGLMLIATIVISVWSKNDLELFADHCWLGKNYGGGDPNDKTGKAWMMGQSWPSLRYDGNREASDRWQRQKMALLRLMSGFKTWIGAYHSSCGGQVFPSYVPPTGFFEIEVNVTPEGKSSPKETFRAAVWPTSGDKKWITKQPAWGSFIKPIPQGKPWKSFEIRAIPHKFKGWEWDLRVRLNLDGTNYLPATKSYVVNKLRGSYEYASSSDVD